MTPGAVRLLADILMEVRTRPLRAAMTAVALGVGTAALSGLLAVLGGLDARAAEAIESLGAGVVAVVGAPASTAQGRGALSSSHLAVLRAGLPRAEVAAVRSYPAPTLARHLPLTVIEAGPELASMQHWRVIAGRFLDAVDLRQRMRSALVSDALARRWGWAPGDVLMVGSIAFTIVGVVERTGNAATAMNPALASGTTVVIVPHTTMPRWQHVSHFPDDDFDAIFIRGSDTVDEADTLAAAQRLLSGPGLNASEFSWLTAESMTRETRALQTALAVTIGSATVLLLIAGGAMVMGLSFANTRERTAEIGLRRALGATRADITTLFVTEAALIAGVSAAAAIAVAAALLTAAAAWVPVSLRFEVVSVVVPWLIALALAAGCTWWPARAAANLVPASALRAE